MPVRFSSLDNHTRHNLSLPSIHPYPPSRPPKRAAFHNILRARFNSLLACCFHWKPLPVRRWSLMMMMMLLLLSANSSFVVADRSLVVFCESLALTGWLILPSLPLFRLSCVLFLCFVIGCRGG